MAMAKPSRRLFAGGLVAAGATGRLLAAADRAPNVLLIVADDLGWADVGYHGSVLRTPSIDKLARSGAELHQHYVAPVCSPTRCALLSGRYWSRFGVNNPQATQAMPFGTITLASALKARGYETCITGKWHLGSLPAWGPRKFGFDHSYGALGGGTGPWDHRYKSGPYTLNWHRNDEYVTEQGHVTDLIAREAIRFLGARRSAPFFLYVPFTAVHHPIAEPQAWLDANRDIDERRRQYAACVQHMDDAIGRLIAALEKTGQRGSTLVVFTSDNGGMGNPANDLKAYPGEYQNGLLGENRPLRGQKGQVYEGGIRVPAFVNWPGRIAAGRVDAPIHVVDWFPTISNLAGYRPQRDLRWDGQDVWPLLTGKGRPSPRDLYWKGPGGRSFAARSGDWKLVVHETSDGSQRPEELFNLRDDPYEEHDRAGDKRQTALRLNALLTRQRSMDDDAAPGPSC
ncbi:MAG TPA: sulfatase-like hydrolase/transferase [Bryobacteraceae bacterium]|nr:sulfatase-like hydrolase/transferase [Bryobacteraceae bacterium]